MPESRKKVKRRYNSATRREQAAGTRSHILGVAAKLFAERGYGGTTMESIAAAAEVGVATVYANFGTKAAIPAALVDQTARDQRLDVRLVTEEPSLDKALRRGAGMMRELHERSTALTDLLRSASGHEPVLEKLWQRWQAQHLTAMRQVAQGLSSLGLLRAGVRTGEATDVLYTLTGAETYRELVGERGWSPRRYQAWLEVALRQLLIDPARSIARH